MIITALVEIRLNMDGTWELLSLKNAENDHSKRINDTKKGGVTPLKPEKMGVLDHFTNRDHINDKRKFNAIGNSSAKHCSECGKVHHNILTHPHHS